MNKLSAKEFLKNKGYGSGTNYTTGAVAVLMEQFATARLEAYKEEVREWVNEEEKKSHRRGGAFTIITSFEIKSFLNRKTPAKKNTEAEHDWCGCVMPCSECKAKKKISDERLFD